MKLFEVGDPAMLSSARTGGAISSSRLCRFHQKLDKDVAYDMRRKSDLFVANLNSMPYIDGANNLSIPRSRPFAIRIRSPLYLFNSVSHIELYGSRVMCLQPPWVVDWVTSRSFDGGVLLSFSLHHCHCLPICLN